MTVPMLRRGQAPAERSRLPTCPSHLTPAAAKEWRRVARALHRMGVVTEFDRAALAAYCQAYGRWVEAEEKLKETPILFRTPSGYVQQSPWLGIANKQLELMGRFMTELGMTPAARSRVEAIVAPQALGPLVIERVIVSPEPRRDRPGDAARIPVDADTWPGRHSGEPGGNGNRAQPRR
jgi:P27 family predicted phage terminase small subunit